MKSDSKQTQTVTVLQFPQDHELRLRDSMLSLHQMHNMDHELHQLFINIDLRNVCRKYDEYKLA